MKHWEIQVGGRWNSAAIARTIERAGESCGLSQSMKGSLRKFEGCTHWHFKKPGHSGTIELTMWSQERRVWISVQAGRRADWIKRELPEIIDMLQRALA